MVGGVLFIAYFGVDAIKDTFDSAMRSWSSDIKYLTELTMVMSWKCGIYFEEGNYEYNHRKRLI